MIPVKKRFISLLILISVLLYVENLVVLGNSKPYWDLEKNGIPIDTIDVSVSDTFPVEVWIARARAHGKKQRIETLINEEALLLAKYLRGEKETWIPRLSLPCAQKSKIQSPVRNTKSSYGN